MSVGHLCDLLVSFAVRDNLRHTFSHHEKRRYKNDAIHMETIISD